MGLTRHREECETMNNSLSVCGIDVIYPKGRKLLNFARANNVAVSSTFFKIALTQYVEAITNKH